MKNIYDPKFVEHLFDRMSASYPRMNYITSFGFSERWRQQCVEEIEIEKGKVTVDLMTGMGECWKHILRQSDENSILIGLDFSTEMIHRANIRKAKNDNYNIKLLKENVFNNSISSNSADYVISGFGLKTFNTQQLDLFASEIQRILKPNGKFCLVDVSVPKNRILSRFYLFYLKKIIPILGKLFLGSPETYKMLGIYTQKFGDSKNVYNIFRSYNFKIEYIEYFYGCSSGLKGKKIA